MDPGQLASAADQAEGKAKRLFDEVTKKRSEIKLIKGEMEKLALTGQRNVELTRRQADSHPDQTDYWIQKADQEQEQIDQQMQKMQMDLEQLQKEADEAEQEANADHQEAVELQEKKRNRQAMLLAIENAENESQRAS